MMEIHVKYDFHVIWFIIIHHLRPSIFVKEARLWNALCGIRWIVSKHALNSLHLLVPVCHVVLILFEILEITDSLIILSPDIIKSLHALFPRQSFRPVMILYSPRLFRFRKFLGIYQAFLSIENCWSSGRIIFQIYYWVIIIVLYFLSLLFPLFGSLLLGGSWIDLSLRFLNWLAFIPPLSIFVEEFTEQ